VPRAQKRAKPKAKKRSELAEKLNRVLRKQPSVKAGERVGVAVSGGADSVGLLRVLLELRAELGIVPVVLHFNHQLRGRASDADEQFVKKLAEQHGLEFFVGRADVAGRKNRERENLEAVARKSRYAFFEKLQSEGQITKIAVAHTADDQAETVLAHILRGTGLSGLRGIHPQTPVVFRPLLGMRGKELRAYLKTLKQSWREDATNRDTRRTRARIRKKLLPLLEKDFNPGVVEHLCQLAELAREDEAYLGKQAELRVELLAEYEAGEMRIPTFELLHTRKQLAASEVGGRSAFEIAADNLALSKRMVRRLVEIVKQRSGQLSAAHVDAVLELAAQKDSGKIMYLPGGVELRREKELLRFRAAGKAAESSAKKEPQEYAYKIDLKGGPVELQLVELSCVLRFREIDWPAEGGETREIGAVLDVARLRQPLVLRNWKPGDAMRPRGHQKAHTVARLLNEKSVSRWEKQKWPVLASGEEIAWVRGLAESAEFAAGPETRRAVLISEERLL
jgi:tRNA(Ile)-lysidine synthase